MWIRACIMGRQSMANLSSSLPISRHSCCQGAGERGDVPLVGATTLAEQARAELSMDAGHLSRERFRGLAVELRTPIEFLGRETGGIGLQAHHPRAEGGRVGATDPRRGQTSGRSSPCTRAGARGAARRCAPWPRPAEFRRAAPRATENEAQQERRLPCAPSPGRALLPPRALAAPGPRGGPPRRPRAPRSRSSWRFVNGSCVRRQNDRP